MNLFLHIGHETLFPNRLSLKFYKVEIKLVSKTYYSAKSKFQHYNERGYVG